MKLFIDTDVVSRMRLSDADLREEQDEINAWIASIRAVFKRFGVHAEVQVEGDEVRMRLPAQKIVLDEWGMNTLFVDGLRQLINFDLRFVELGGEGCDFALEITNPRAVF